MSSERRKSKDKKDFNNSYSASFRVRTLCSPAFRELTSAAKLVCLFMFMRNDNAGHNGDKTPDGRPYFKCTVVDAREWLHISTTTLAAAIRQIETHGLIVRLSQGGLKGCNGTATTFTLSKRWLDWKPEVQQRAHTNIKKALKAKAAKAKEREKAAKYPLSVFQVGMEVYFHIPASPRAKRGRLITRIECGWQIEGRRSQDKFHAPIFEVAENNILTIEAQHVKRPPRGIIQRQTQPKPAYVEPANPAYISHNESAKTSKPGFCG